MHSKKEIPTPQVLESEVVKDELRRKIHKVMTQADPSKFYKFEDLPDYTIKSYDDLIDLFNLK